MVWNGRASTAVSNRPDAAIAAERDAFRMAAAFIAGLVG